MDKPLLGVKAVETLSRVNRALPEKHDTLVPNLAKDVGRHSVAFGDYCRATVFSEKFHSHSLLLSTPFGQQGSQLGTYRVRR